MRVGKRVFAEMRQDWKRHRQGKEPMAQKATAKKSSKKVVAKKAAAGGRAGVGARKADAPKGKAVKKAATPKVSEAARGAVKVAVGSNGQGAKLAAAAKTAVALKEPKKEKVPSLSKSDLQYFRNLLIERRRELIGDIVSNESEAFKGGSNLSNMPIHMADVGTDNFEQEFTLGLIESERNMLRDIQEALIRIENGTYGICQGTGKAIPKVRLEAVPWAKYTMEYQGMLEQGMVGRDESGSEEESGGGDDDED